MPVSRATDGDEAWDCFLPLLLLLLDLGVPLPSLATCPPPAGSHTPGSEASRDYTSGKLAGPSMHGRTIGAAGGAAGAEGGRGLEGGVA